MDVFEGDKSTVFSIVPFPIHEFKPGLYPGTFNLEPCLDFNQPQRLLVRASNYTVHVGGRKAPIMVMTPSYQIAKSVVDDFLDGQLYTEPNARPGICWVQGDMSVKEFVLGKKVLYEDIQARQKNWFVRLCRETDNLWHKYKHPRVVSDQARFAATFLGIPTPDWMTTENTSENFDKCPACGTMNDKQNLVCSNCLAVQTPQLKAAKTKDEKLAALTFAGGKK